MTFLNSALLAGLAAAALPILIHLFSRRKFPRIDFSTLRFLRHLQRQQMRRLQMRQWLLLLLRTLGVLLIVLAFARPAQRGRAGMGAHQSGRLSVAIVLDASASMQARNSSGTCFHSAKEAVQTLLSLMNPGDRAFLVAARKQPQILTAEPTADSAAVQQALEKAQPWDGEADLAAAIHSAQQALGSGQDFRQEIYVISDFAHLPELADPPVGVVPFFVQTKPETADNLAISEVKVLGEILEPGQPVEIEITLKNGGRRDREDVFYSVFLNGRRAAEDVVSLSAGGEVKRTHQILPESAGLQEGFVRLESKDALAVDDRGYFCFAIPEHIQVLLVGNAASTRPIQIALAPMPEQNKLISVTPADQNNWDEGSISAYHVIIFADPGGFTATQASRLVKFVENGGGLLLFPGSRTDIAAVNRELLSRIGVSQWGENMGASAPGQAFLAWQEPDLNQPLFRGIFRPGSQPVSPHFYQALRLVGGKGEAPVHYQNGMPFMAETRTGLGNVIIASSSPDPKWSDWSERGIFAPLIHRLVLRLAGGSKERCQALQVGDSLEIPARSEGTAVAILTDPTGNETRIPPRVVGQKAVYAAPALNPAGLYELRVDSSVYEAAVNVPASESNFAEVDLPVRYPKWAAANLIVTTPTQLAEKVKGARYGRELWKSFLAAGLILLLLESLLGSSPGRLSQAAPEKEVTDAA